MSGFTPDQAKNFVAGVNITDGTVTKLKDTDGVEWIVNAVMNPGYKLVIAQVEAGEPIYGTAFWDVVDTRVVDYKDYSSYEVVK